MTFESKSAQVCCKLLQVREIKLITHPIVFQDYVPLNTATYTHNHTHAVTHAPTTGAERYEDQGFFVPFLKRQ